MIPCIEEIVAMLLVEKCTESQAIAWLNKHREMADEDMADLRDHFAGLAMQAAATNPAGADGFSFAQRAEWAYQQADAMLTAREAK